MFSSLKETRCGRSAPAWLCQYNWDIAERFTHAALTAHGVRIERDGFQLAGDLKRKIDCNAAYRLMDYGLWWPLLEGKRLAIISGHAHEFADRLIRDVTTANQQANAEAASRPDA